MTAALPASVTLETLPSTRRLLRATAIAIAVAATLLVTVVLPAEYGIDPTGVGKRLGLDALRAKRKVGAEFDAPPVASAGAAPASTVPGAPISDAAAFGEENFPAAPGQSFERKAYGRYAAAARHETKSVVLPPGEGIELKANMKAGDSFVFHWSATGNVAVDMHGEPDDQAGAAAAAKLPAGTPPPKKFYTSYSMARAKREASGAFTAPFTGRHGWYWLNLGNTPVTVNLEVTGFQSPLFTPPPL